MVALFLTIAFWVITAYALYAMEEHRFPLICVAVWLLAFGIPYLIPSAYLLCIAIRYALPVLLAVWLKINDAL
ncbi:MAG TPA: hypothetical protein VGJ81_00975 [Thermoanaerobaculia bacterium]